MPPPNPGVLMDELVEAFLLRLPPDDPASLVRAALVCKPWRRILGSRGFRRRFRDFHRMPRLWGVVIHCIGCVAPRFVPTSAFRPRNAADLGWHVHDSHHGRVLSVRPFERGAVDVWDPVTGERLHLPRLQLPHEPSGVIHLVGWNAALLCAYGRQFRVVFIGSSPHHGVYVSVYSSEASSWALTASAPQHPIDPFYFNHNQRSALTGSALHFMVGVNRERETRICRYNLDTQEISWINLPPSCSYQDMGRRVMLTSTQYGGLGCARLKNSRLHLWSREVGSNGLFEWVQTRVIELKTMLPSINRFSSLTAFVHGVGVFLVTTGDGLFSIELDSDRATKVCEGSEIDNVVPYVSLAQHHSVHCLQERNQVLVYQVHEETHQSFWWENEVSRDHPGRNVWLLWESCLAVLYFTTVFFHVALVFSEFLCKEWVLVYISW